MILADCSRYSSEPCIKLTRFGLALLVLVMLMLLVACGGSREDISSHLEKARQYQQQQKHNAAIIELKNILQQDADHKQARFLLGMSYLATGNGASAEKELEKSRELGQSGVEFTAALARAKVLQGKYDEALTLAAVDESLTEQQKRDLQILRGDASLGKGDVAQALTAYEQALSLDSDASGAMVGLAKVSLAEGDLEQAERRISPVDEQDENAVDMLLLKAEIATRKKDLDKAEELYQRAFEVSKKHNNATQQLNALSKLSFVLIANNKPDAARDTINRLAKAAPRHPVPKYLSALLAYTQKDYDTALENLQQVIAMAPDHLPASLLLGAVHYAKGNYEQANSYLSTFVNRVPTHIQARTLLGVVRLKLNKPEQAREALDSAVQSSHNDAGLLAAIGRAATASGNARMGIDYLERARQSKPDNPQIRAELAKVYLQEGAFDSAIKELEQITGDKVDQAKLLLVYSYLRKRDFDQARTTAKEMTDQNPKNPGWWTVSASVEMFAGERNKAHDYFDKALQLDENFVPARINLARLAFEDGNLAAAEKQFDQVLSHDANNVTALLGMAQVEERLGNGKQALEWLEKARRSNDHALVPRLILARFYYKTGEVNKSLTIAREAAAINPGNVEVNRLVAASLLKLDKPEEALATYREISKNDPSNPLWKLELANVYQELQDYEQARAALDEALVLDADYLPAKATLATIDLKQNKLEEAMARARSIIKEHPETATGHMLVGDIHARRNQLQEAREAYLQGYEVEPGQVLVNKIFLASGQLNDYDKAIEVSRRWLKKHPADANVRMYLALSYQALGQFEKAGAEYEHVLQIQPNHIMAINNMAYLLIPTDIQRALDYARQAYSLAPDNFAIMDTYGWVMAQAGNIDKALPVLQEAVKKSGNNPSVRFHLAAALAKNNEMQRAVSILNDITSAGQQYPEMAAAKQLLDKIRQ